MKRVILIAAMLFAPPVARADEWTTMDTIGEVAFASLVVIDYSQTSWALQRPGFHEMNPLLGRHPSRAKVAAASVLSIGAHAAISYVLPNPWRRYWQVVSFTVEMENDARNAATIGFNFSF